MARIVGKMFYEVHRNGVPRLLRHQKLLQKSIRFMMRRFGPFASGARVSELLDKCVKVRPNIVTMYCFKGFVLPNMSCKDMIMFILKDFELEVQNVWYENLII